MKKETLKTNSAKKVVATQYGDRTWHTKVNDRKYSAKTKTALVKEINTVIASCGDMTEDEFFEKYKPVKNHLVKGAPFGDAMFETFGEEIQYVLSIARKTPQYVWTIHHGEGNEIFYQAGYHLVNRLGYFITEKPWEKETLEIVI